MEQDYHPEALANEVIEISKEEGELNANIPVYQFVLQKMVLAIFYTWIYKNTRGVVLVMILFHSIGNVVGVAIPYWTTDLGRWINFGVLVVFALAITLIWVSKNLSRSNLEK
jgi:hypothetical protein